MSVTKKAPDAPTIHFLRLLFADRRRKLFNEHCAWCGRPCVGQVCVECRDLEYALTEPWTL